MSELHKIGLGTVQFGLNYGISNTLGRTPTAEVANILEFSRQSKITYLDTASAYGDAEKVLGSCGVKHFRLISKFMPVEEGRAITVQLCESLSKLKLDAIYGYLAHRPEDLSKNPEQWEELEHLKQEGKINKIGFSLNRPAELEPLLAKKMFPDLIQVPFNVFDHRFESLLKEMSKEGCEVHTRSAFLQGLFFIPPESLGRQFDPIKETLTKLQQAYGSNLPGALLNHVLQQEFIDVVILGVENLRQLKENIEKIEKTTAVNMEIPYLEEDILMPSLWPSQN